MVLVFTCRKVVDDVKTKKKTLEPFSLSKNLNHILQKKKNLTDRLPKTKQKTYLSPSCILDRAHKTENVESFVQFSVQQFFVGLNVQLAPTKALNNFVCCYNFSKRHNSCCCIILNSNSMYWIM